MIHANSNYSTEVGGHSSMQSARQDFGFVKIDVEDIDGNIDQFTALIVGIVEESSINMLESNRTIFSHHVLVAWLEAVPLIESIKSNIPYPQIKFTFANRSPTSPLWFDIVPIRAIKSPLFVIPIISSVPNYCLGQSYVAHKKRIKFYELTVEKVIFWSTSDYDNFTEGNDSLSSHSQFSNVDTIILTQGDIELQSDLWRNVRYC
jgi:hypothetical protein